MATAREPTQGTLAQAIAASGAVLLALLMTGCSDDAPALPVADAGAFDAGTARPDAGASDGATADGATADGATATPDGAPTDAGSAVADAGGPGGGVVGPTITDFVASGPITVHTGEVITGLRITNPDGPCISGSDVSDVQITNNMIGPCGPTSAGVGIDLYVASRVRVDHNAFDDVASAFYVIGAGGGTDLVFDHNLATRIRGPFPRGQLVQLNDVHGGGHRIVCNVSDQTVPGYLVGPEDHVNIFSSAGTAASPIEIAFNKIRGGGPSMSGGGLLAGDNDSAYVDVHDNVLINPGQYGLAIAGGHDFRYLRNRVYASDVFAWSNIGLYVWNQTPGAPCFGHEVRDNRVFYRNAMGAENHAWNADNCGPVAGWAENTWGDATLGAAMWDEAFAACD